jgi:hypothetical protein
MFDFKILSLLLCFWTPKLLPIVQSIWFTVKFAEKNYWFLPFLGGICMEGTLRLSNFKFRVFFLVPGPQYSSQKYHQICSTGKFAEQNSSFNPS